MKTLEILVLLSICVTLTHAGVSFGSGDGHKYKSSGSAGHSILIKGGIGDGYIYPVKTKHHGGSGGGGTGGSVQAYKIVIKNAKSQPQDGHVKTFKVITKNHAIAPEQAHSAHVKTIKLIHVNGGSSNSPHNEHGWQ